MDRPSRYTDIVLSGIHKMPHDVRVELDEVRHLFYDRKTGLAPKRGVLRNALTQERPKTYDAISAGDLDTYGGLVITETLNKGGVWFFSVANEKAHPILSNSPTRLRDFATRSENVGRIAKAAAAKARQVGDHTTRATAVAMDAITAASAAQATGLRELATVLEEAEEA